jgi:hypothetical protein
MYASAGACRGISTIYFEGFGKVGIFEWREPQINFLADSLAGVGLGQRGAPATSARRAGAKRAHHFLWHEYYVPDVPTGFKRGACRKCGARIDL